MKNHLSYCSECLIYPGEYTPVHKREAGLSGPKNPDQKFVTQPPVNMDEYDDHYTIEVQIPGVSRESILVHVHDNFLYIMVLGASWPEEKRKLQIHEFSQERMERQVQLPENADAEFVSAEYKHGMLKLYIPKTEGTIIHPNSNIVVY
jgi:HSP20 family protein